MSGRSAGRNGDEMIDLDARGLRPAATAPAHIAGVGTIGELLDPLVRERPDQPILIGRSGHFTVAELATASNRAANALRQLGVRRGTRVAASLPNDVDVVVAFLGAMKVGAIWLGVNRPLAAPEKAYMLRDSQSGVFIGDADALAQVAMHRSELPELHSTLAVGSGDGTGADHRWDDVVADAEIAPQTDIVDPLAPAAIAYTSGTTGFPKGAVHTQHNLLLPGKVGALRGTAEAAVIGVPLPLTILNLMILGPLAAYQAGHTLVAMDRVDGLGMAEWIQAERVTTIAAVPAMLHDLLTHPDVSDDMLESITNIGVGGADMPDAFRRLYEKRFHRRVGSGYGLTEAPTAVTVEDVDAEPVAGASGTALPQVTIHIVDDDDRHLGPGEVGEVCVGPALDGPFADVYRPMLGYWNRPEESAKALRGGLLHTGDVGLLDEGGNLLIKDRKNDLIIRGGANVYPAEIERVLHDVAGVAACAVVGRPDDRLGERVVAFVECSPGATLEEAALREHCLENLARYKVPDVVEFVSAFDRTPMGKIRKGPLRESAAGF